MLVCRFFFRFENFPKYASIVRRSNFLPIFELFCLAEKKTKKIHHFNLPCALCRSFYFAPKWFSIYLQMPTRPDTIIHTRHTHGQKPSKKSSKVAPALLSGSAYVRSRAEVKANANFIDSHDAWNSEWTERMPSEIRNSSLISRLIPFMADKTNINDKRLMLS